MTDFKIGEVDVDLGIGYGLTPGSDRWVAKTILSYEFPVPGKKKNERLELRNEVAHEFALDVPSAIDGADGAKSFGGPAEAAAWMAAWKGRLACGESSWLVGRFHGSNMPAKIGSPRCCCDTRVNEEL